MKEELNILIDKSGLRPSDLVKGVDGLSLQQASRWLKKIKDGKSTLAIDSLVKRVCLEISDDTPHVDTISDKTDDFKKEESVYMIPNVDYKPRQIEFVEGRIVSPSIPRDGINPALANTLDSIDKATAKPPINIKTQGTKKASDVVVNWVKSGAEEVAFVKVPDGRFRLTSEDYVRFGYGGKTYELDSAVPSGHYETVIDGITIRLSGKFEDREGTVKIEKA
jgi:hypothetical protein